MSGRDCPCCTQWSPTRTSEKHAWQRLEWQQADPWTPWSDCVSSHYGLEDNDDTIQYGYWSVMQDRDWFLNEQARPYLAG